MKRLACLPLLFLIAAPAVADEKADNDAVLTMLAGQVAAWNRGDLNGFMDGYWNSPELSFYSGRDKQKGWQQTHDRYKKRYQAEGREMGKLDFSELEPTRLAEGRIMVLGRWKLDLKAETIDGLFTLIVEKKDGGWKVVHDHTSAGEPKKKP